MGDGTTSLYETVKRYLWPHTLAPLALIVLLDYAAILAILVQIAAGTWLGLQIIAGPLGFVAAALAHFSESSPWADVFKYRIMRFFPLAGGGKLAFDYLLTEVNPPQSRGESAPSRRINLIEDEDEPKPLGKGNVDPDD